MTRTDRFLTLCMFFGGVALALAVAVSMEGF